MENLTKEDLIQFLKDNLEISISTKPDMDYYRGLSGYSIEVRLTLGDIILSEASDSIDIK